MVSIGVSGHRSIKDVEAVYSAVDDVLATVITQFEGNSFIVISPLAEGADRIVAWRALANYPVQLIVPLPLEMADYMDDFESISSKAEFTTLLEQADNIFELPAEDTREACYRAAGIYVLDHSDVLIALWDGAPARGMGGTAEIVAEARRRGMPVAWVQVTRPERDSSPHKRKAAGGVRILYERLPAGHENEAGAK